MTRKPHILILSDPPATPGYMPRMRYLCDFLVQKGYEITWITETQQTLLFKHTYPIITVPLYSGKFLDWLFKTIWTILTDWHSRAFAKKVLSHLMTNTNTSSFDMVFCSTFSYYPLGAGYRIAQKLNIPLHIDLRDIDEQAPDSQYQAHRQWWARPFRRLYRTINIHRRNEVIKRAQSVTSVSPWHIDFLRPLNKNVSLIYNGFDNAVFTPCNRPSKHFYISYVGRLYEQKMQDPTLLFKALQTIDIDLHVSWYTNKEGQQRLRRMAKNYGIESLMEFHDYVPIDQVPDLLYNASILLVLTNKAKSSGAHGIMTTKFFEALGVEKPVLCIPSDEECLAAAIKETNAGIAATSIEEVKAFIQDKYAEWKKNGFTRQATTHRADFSREAQSERMLNIIKQILKQDKE